VRGFISFSRRKAAELFPLNFSCINPAFLHWDARALLLLSADLIFLQDK
jgi:hypothetical protein